MLCSKSSFSPFFSSNTHTSLFHYSSLYRYALSLASRGAKVVVNDLGPSTQDKNRKAAEVVVEEITKAGGEAIANLDSNLEGAKIVKQAVDKWGRIDILINNAGILRDKSFKSMSDQEWDAITAVHITGSYACAHAAWPHFRKQKVRPLRKLKRESL